VPRSAVKKQDELVGFGQYSFEVADKIHTVAGRVLPIDLPPIVSQRTVDTSFSFVAGYKSPGTGAFFRPHPLDRDLIMENTFILSGDGPPPRFSSKNISVFLLKKRLGRLL